MVKQLSAAIEVKEVPLLRKVIQEATAFQLEHEEDLKVLQEAVSTMQRELWPQARQGLQVAVELREIEKLREALEEADLVGGEAILMLFSRVSGRFEVWRRRRHSPQGASLRE